MTRPVLKSGPPADMGHPRGKACPHIVNAWTKSHIYRGAVSGKYRAGIQKGVGENAIIYLANPLQIGIHPCLCLFKGALGRRFSRWKCIWGIWKGRLVTA